MENRIKALVKTIRTSFPVNSSGQRVLDNDILQSIVTPPHLYPPGFFLLKNALNEKEQTHLASKCFNEYAFSPYNNVSVLNLGSLSTQEYLKKLRWTCLGYNFNWNKRIWEEDSRIDFPSELKDQAIQLCKIAQVCDTTSFLPDVGIVNFYQPSQSMGPHRDDVELAIDQPLVSISLGCTALFVVENVHQEDICCVEVKSGDVIILHGPSRLALHSVAAIFNRSYTAPPPLPNALQEGWMSKLENMRVNVSIKQMEDFSNINHTFEGRRRCVSV